MNTHVKVYSGQDIEYFLCSESQENPPNLSPLSDDIRGSHYPVLCNNHFLSFLHNFITNRYTSNHYKFCVF